MSNAPQELAGLLDRAERMKLAEAVKNGLISPTDAAIIILTGALSSLKASSIAMEEQGDA